MSSAKLVLADPASDVYYTLSVAAGDDLLVVGDTEIDGDVYAGADIDLQRGSRVTGDASAVGRIRGQGQVDGTRLEGAAPRSIPPIPGEAALRALADRTFEGDTAWDDAVVDDIVFVNGTLRVRGELRGSGTVVATGDVRLDTVQGPPGASDLGSFLSLIAFDDVRVGKDRSFRGVIHAGRDLTVEKNADVEGVLVAGRRIHLKKDGSIRFRSPDPTPPQVSIVAPAENPVIEDTTPLIEAVYSDDFSGIDLATVRVTVDGLDLAATCELTDSAVLCEPPELAHGPHEVVATVADRAGNQAANTLVFDLVSDTEPPTVSVREPGVVLYNESNPVVVVDYEDAVAVVDLSSVAVVMDETDLTTFCEIGPSSASCLSNTLDAGPHTVTARLSDLAGNVGSTSFVFTLGFDLEPPRLEFTAPVGELITGETDVALAYSDDGGDVVPETLRVRVDGLDVTSRCTVGPATATCVGLDLRRGLREVSAEIEDLRGNKATASKSFTFDFPLAVEIVEPAAGLVSSEGTVRVTGTMALGVSSVRVAGIEAALSGGSFVVEALGLGEGVHDLIAVAVDADGNTGLASRRVTVDTTSPSVSVLWPPEGLVVRSPTIPVNGLVNDLKLGTVNDPEVTVSVNGLAVSVAHRSFFAPVVELAPGENVLRVVAFDRAGNAAAVERRVIYREPVGEAAVLEVSGNAQRAPVLSELPEPLVVRILDVTGQPAPGARVVFRVVRGDGTLETGQRAIVMETNAAGLASARWTLGRRAGAGSNQVRATAVGVAGEVSFAAFAETVEPERIHVAAGDNQRGAVGRRLPRPLEAVVLDAGGNPVEGVAVTFEVAGGGGSFAGGEEAVTLTDGSGRAAVDLRLGGLPGFDNNLVAAGFEGMTQRPVIFKASGFVLGDPRDTRITGVVLGPQDQPVPGTTLRLHDTDLITTSDASGQFRLLGVPPGHVMLEVDASTAQLPGTWSSLEFEMVTLPGVENTLEKPVYVLPLDVEHGVYVDEQTGATATLAEIPGFALEIAPGSVTFPDGTRSGVVSVTAVKTDKIPMAPGSGMQPRLIVTVQPAGARFDPPARVTFPNVDALAAGTVTELFSFDHDVGDFVAIGTGTVSEDRTVIVSDPGFGIVKAGWHCGSLSFASGAGSGFDVEFTQEEPIVLCLNEGGLPEVSDLRAEGTFSQDAAYAFSIDDPTIVRLLDRRKPVVCEGNQPVEHCPEFTVCTAPIVPEKAGRTTAEVVLKCCPSGEEVVDEIDVVVLDSDLLEIYDGQDAQSPVPEAEEETIGAFTVANMNDTDDDGIVDNIDSDVLATASGRDEVDLMKVVVKRPSIDLGGSVELRVEGIAVDFWESSTKGRRIALSGRSIHFATGSLPRTLWLEAPTHSTAVKDIKLTATYLCSADTVRATAVWANFSRMLHDTLLAEEVVAIPDWANVTDPPRDEFFRRFGTGLNPRFGFDDTGIRNGILIKFTILPKDLENFLSDNSSVKALSSSMRAGKRRPMAGVS